MSDDAQTTTLNELEIGLLLGLVRVERRKKERGLARFRQHPEQPADAAREARERIERKIAYLTGVDEKLRVMERQARDRRRDAIYHGNASS